VTNCSMDRPVLFLLTASSISRHQRIYSGMCLTEERPDEELDHGVTVRLSRPGHPVPVRLVRHQVTHSHLSTDRGSLWETDGRIESTDEADWHAELLREARNQIDRLKFVPPIPDLALPAFAGTTPNLRPCFDDLIVRMRPRHLIDLPDVLVLLHSSRAGILADHPGWRSAPVAPSLITPVEYGDGRQPTRGALHLKEAVGDRVDGSRFRCRLYRSGAEPPLAVGTVLRRRAARHLHTGSILEKMDVAEVLAVEAGARPIEPEPPGSGIVRVEKNGAVFPIRCSSCGATFPPARFTPEQLQTLDVWGWYHPVEGKRSLLGRVHAMYRRHPEARGRIQTKLQGLFFSSGVARDFNTPIGRQPDPRPADYQQNLDLWTEGDRELREFLETHTYNHDRLFQDMTRQCAKYERELGGRCVVCPTCGDGMLRTPTELGLRATDADGQ
jgi:hypothetical protein